MVIGRRGKAPIEAESGDVLHLEREDLQLQGIRQLIDAAGSVDRARLERVLVVSHG